MRVTWLSEVCGAVETGTGSNKKNFVKVNKLVSSYMRSGIRTPDISKDP